MITLQQLLGSNSILGPTLSTNFFESRTWVAPQDGIVIVRGMGAGGGGARGATSATGGYSGSWGCKIVRVKKGDAISVAIGAGGIGRSIPDGNGAAGGDTIITIDGVQYIAYGGPGGVAGAAGPLPDGPSPSASWDFGAASVKPGWVASGRTGGAGVDILAQGNNATTSASIAGSGGGGTGGPSPGPTGGGAMPSGASATGTTYDTSSGNTRAVYFDASDGEWGISFYGGSGAPLSPGAALPGGNGGGGGRPYSSGEGGPGGPGGGGGAVLTSDRGGTGGIGGGGGGSSVTGGNGGQGYAHLKFFADMGV